MHDVISLMYGWSQKYTSNPQTAGVIGWISDSYCSIKPLCSGMGEVVPARTSPTLPPHPLAPCCHYPVSRCPSASIVVTSTVSRVKPSDTHGLLHHAIIIIITPNILLRLWVFTSRPFLKTAGGIVLGSVAVSAVSADVLPYISVAIKASFMKLGMCNICKNNIAKMFLDF